MLLVFAVARLWPQTHANAMTPGWVATRMGGDLAQGHLTQIWLAVDEGAQATGGYFYHKQPARVHAAAHDIKLQDRLLDPCREVSGVALG